MALLTGPPPKGFRACYAEEASLLNLHPLDDTKYNEKVEIRHSSESSLAVLAQLGLHPTHPSSCFLVCFLVSSSSLFLWFYLFLHACLGALL
jgi:hypothetical protein